MMYYTMVTKVTYTETLNNVIPELQNVHEKCKNIKST